MIKVAELEKTELKKRQKLRKVLITKIKESKEN